MRSQVIKHSVLRAPRVIPARRATLRIPRPVRASADRTDDEPTTVNIVLQGRNFPLSDSIKNYAVEKISRAVKPFEGEVKEVNVRFELHDKHRGQHHGQHQRCEIVLYTLHNGTVVIEDTEPELYASIDLCVDKMKRALRKTKEKAIDKGKWPGHAGPRRPNDMVSELGLRQEEEPSEEDYIRQAGPLGPFKK